MNPNFGPTVAESQNPSFRQMSVGQLTKTVRLGQFNVNNQSSKRMQTGSEAVVEVEEQLGEKDGEEIPNRVGLGWGASS